MKNIQCKLCNFYSSWHLNGTNVYLCMACKEKVDAAHVLEKINGCDRKASTFFMIYVRSYSKKYIYGYPD